MFKYKSLYKISDRVAEVQKARVDEFDAAWLSDNASVRRVRAGRNPFVHGAYYDDVVAGEYYVRCADDNLIRKRNAVLLATGEFAERSAELSTGSSAANRIIQNSLVEEQEKHFMYNSETDAYFPLSSYISILGCNVGSHEDYIVRQFGNFREASGVSFSYLDTFNEELCAEYIQSSLNENRNLLEDFSRRATVLKEELTNYTYLGKTHSGEDLYGTSDNYQTIQGKEVYSMRCTGEYGGGDVMHKYIPIEIKLTDIFSVSMLVETLETANNINSPRSLSRDDSNECGDLMNYSARVDNYKHSFKRTASEEKSKKKYTSKKVVSAEAYQTQRKAIATSSLALTTKLRKMSALNAKSTEQVSDTTPFLGFELEMQTKRHLNRSTILSEMARTPSIGDNVIFKSDSSIGYDRGLEMVSIPATLKYHKEFLAKDFFPKFSSDMVTPSSCGLHIHISKAAFTPKGLSNFLDFIYNPKTSRFITAIAGRGSGSYCGRTMDSGRPNEFKTAVQMVKRGCIGEAFNGGLRTSSGIRHSRNSAVNLNNSKTVELRMFKASTNKNNIFRKLEFAEALFNYSHRLTSLSEEASVHTFVDFMLEPSNRRDYPHLLSWLGAKGYVKHIRRRNIKTKKLHHVYEGNLVRKPTKQGETKCA